MKRIFLLIISILVLFESKSQLTYGEVYDFNVGDVFHYSTSYDHMGNNVDFQYYNDSIISRTHFIDSVVYEVYRKHSTVYPQSSSNYSEGVHTLKYYNLLDTCKSELPFCYCDSLKDTTYYDSTLCSLRIHQFDMNQSICGNCGFGKPHKFIKGVGDFYDYSLEGGDRYIKSLGYFKKDSIECGEKNIVYNSVEEKVKLVINISPNPSKQFISVISTYDFPKYEIRNSFGQSVQSGLFEDNLTISHLNNGIYFLKLITKENNFHTEKFIKE